MDPEADEILRLLDSILFSLKETLEYIGQVTDIELVMEVLGSLSELELHITEQG
jgi:hypothetical protein